MLERHLQLLSAVCRVDAGQPSVAPLLPPLVDALLESALSTAADNPGLFSNTLLVYLGLIKVWPRPPQPGRTSLYWPREGRAGDGSRHKGRTSDPQRCR